MAHSIITVATMKGGSGKSTLASCLAVHWQLNNRRSAIIDADPQRTVARLSAELRRYLDDGTLHLQRLGL